MNLTRWTIAVTALMSLLNLPAGFDSANDDLPTALSWAATAVGVLGVVAILGLVRRAGWGRPLTIAVGALNVGGGVWALADGHGDGIVGIVLGAAIVALTVVSAPRHVAASPEQVAR